MAETQAIPVKKERDSNMELARIVAMVAITLYHFVSHGIFKDGALFCSNDSLHGAELVLAYCTVFCMFGTDLFAMISGYYKIRLSWKSILSLWCLCVFYNILALLVNRDFSISSILHSLFISGRNQQWYFAAYFWLLLFSPILNKGLNALSLLQLRVSAIVTLFLCGLSGWFLKSVNLDGHNIVQLIAMYIVGRWVATDAIFCNVKRWKWFLTFFLSIGIGLLFINLNDEWGVGMLLSHNNPFVMISAISVLVLFKSLTIKNRVVNFVALSMPAVLLLTDHVIFNQLYGLVHSWYSAFGISYRLILWIAVAIICCFVLSLIIDTIRRVTLTPLILRLSNLIASKWNKIYTLCQQQ